MVVSFGRDGVGSQPFYLPVLKVSAGSKVALQVISHDVLSVGVHWVGHAMLCPGEGCEICPSQGARGMMLFAGVVEAGGRRKPYLVELPEAAWFRCQRSLFDEAPSTLSPGDHLVLHRKRAKSPLMVDFAAPCEGERKTMAGYLLCQAVAVLYRIPPPWSVEGPAEWFARIRPQLLEAAVRLARRITE